MSKRNSNWGNTLQGRFLRWMRFGWEPMDVLLIDKMSQDRDESVNDALSAAENLRDLQLSEKYNADTAIEHSIMQELDEWSLSKGRKIVNRLYALLSVTLCVTVILLLLETVIAMPMRGVAVSPTNNEVSQRYIEEGMEETGAVNIVAGMILDYRAFDTLGESTVLFIAACAVLILLRIDRDKDGRPTQELIAAEEDDRSHEPKSDRILQGSAMILTPVVLLFGIYVVLNGHLSPGGGFSGGAIIGAGLILYLNAFGFAKASRFFSYKTFALITLLSLSFYALAKAYSFYCGANGLPSGIPLGTPGSILSSGLILPLNICVGMVVACTMYVFYAMFRKGGI
jgi:multicomponent Na+:H+ antiporter subunit B